MDAANPSTLPSRRPPSRLWPDELPLPDDNECLMIFNLLDRVRGTTAKDFNNAFQAAKNQIFRDYLIWTLETTTENFNKGKAKTICSTTLRSRLNEWHLPTNQVMKGEFVASIRSMLVRFRVGNPFVLAVGVDAETAGFMTPNQPIEPATNCAMSEFDTPDSRPSEASPLTVEYQSASLATGRSPAVSFDQGPPKFQSRIPPFKSPFGEQVGFNTMINDQDDDSILFDEGCGDRVWIAPALNQHRSSGFSTTSQQSNDSGYGSRHHSLQSHTYFKSAPSKPATALDFDQDYKIVESHDQHLMRDLQNDTYALLDVRPGKSRSQRNPKSPNSSTTEIAFELKFQPNHDKRSGIWYGRLRTLPCELYHANIKWNSICRVCTICGFSKAQSLPTHGHKMDADMYNKEFLKMMDEIFNARGENPPLLRDKAGNTPLHFAAAAGLTYAHLSCMFYLFRDEVYAVNAWGQNIFHVLNPVHISGELSGLLEWFESTKRGFIDERDVSGQTVLQSLLQYPINKDVVVDIFKLYSRRPEGLFYHIQIVDNLGHNAIWTAQQVGMLDVVQQALAEVISHQRVAREAGRLAQSKNMLENIMSPIQPSTRCPICRSEDSIYPPRVHQMKCAIRAGACVNDYNEGGLTPLQAIISTARYELNGLPEACAKTSRLVKTLLSCSSNPKALVHSRSRDGKTALYMAAERGQDLVVQCLLEVDPDRNREITNVRNSIGISMLEATYLSLVAAKERNDPIIANRCREVLNLLEDADGIYEPSVAIEWAVKL